MKKTPFYGEKEAFVINVYTQIMQDKHFFAPFCKKNFILFAFNEILPYFCIV